MIIIRKKLIILVGFFVFVFFAPAAVRAQGIEITPHVIDEKAKARDILEYTVKLTNNLDRHVFLYAVVNDLSPEEGKQEFGEPANLDKTTSLARWTRISRGVIDIPPGEDYEIPLSVEVNMYAVPGKRHAVVSFVDAPNRWDAEAIAAKGGGAEVIINLDIEDEIIEKAQVEEFKTDKNIYFKLPANFSLIIKNIGNRNIIPKGSIYLYNRRGEEIDKIKINQDNRAITPETIMQFNNSWVGNKKIGKYRAKLEVEYGEKTERDMQDTIYFWLVPKKFIALVGGGTFLLIIILSFVLFRKTYHHHLPVQAPDGVLNLKNRE